MFVSKVSGPHNTREQADESRRMFIRVQIAKDNASKEAFESRHPERTFVPFSPPAPDIYRVESQVKGFIVVLDDPSL